ncbi:hypothetical protein D9M68_452870 [compost metagenome]
MTRRRRQRGWPAAARAKAAQSQQQIDAIREYMERRAAMAEAEREASDAAARADAAARLQRLAEPRLIAHRVEKDSHVHHSTTQDSR